MFNSKKQLNYLIFLTLIAVIFCYVVIGMGAFTRLTDAGLGCPDWPACYGHLVVPKDHKTISLINTQYLHAPLVVHKAQFEMWHRYAAGILGLLILLIAGGATVLSVERGASLLVISLGLAGLLAYQVVLGMWTVTLKLMPIIVTQHLLGGMFILSLLWLMYLRLKNSKLQLLHAFPTTIFRVWATVLLICVILQITLGAWTSSNYAALVCHGVFSCQPLKPLVYDFKNAFQIVSMSGVNYEGGILSDSARMTIQMTHRYGALVIVILCFGLFFSVLRRGSNPIIKKTISYLIAFVILQIALGFLNVVLRLPLVLAIAHNLVAATILLTLVTLNYYLYSAPK